MLRRSLKTERIVEKLRQGILQGQVPDGAKLPTIRQMARRFQVSPDTVQASLRQLRKEGLIVSRRGSGVFVKNPTGVPAKVQNVKPIPLRVRRTRSKEVADRIMADIIAGLYHSGDCLPLQKELSFRYHTSKESVRQCLGILVQRGLIHAVGSGFLIGAPNERRGTRKQRHVTILEHSGRWHNLLYGNRPLFEFFRGLDAELAKYGIASRTYMDPDRLAGSDLRASRLIDNIGFVYVLHRGRLKRLGKTELVQIGQHCRQLLRTKQPVVLFDYAKILEWFPEHVRTLPTGVFPVGSTEQRAGQSVALLLAMRGHRHIGLFDLFSSEDWVINRFRGVRQGIELLQGKEHLRTFSCHLQDVRVAGQEIEKALTPGLRQLYNREWIPYTRSPEWRGVMESVAESIRRGKCRKVIWPLFEQALLDSSITAWVCVDGLVTILAMAFLKAKNVDVPGQISLVGIDDIKETVVMGVDMFDFQYGAMGALAVHCLLGDWRIRKSKEGLVEFVGRMVERGSVRRV